MELNAILNLQSENVTIFSYILLLRVILCLKKKITLKAFEFRHYIFNTFKLHYVVFPASFRNTVEGCVNESLDIWTVFVSVKTCSWVEFWKSL